jgi:MarR family 2-MHQ and catechol resistance regulon transcriptional repressor
MATHYEGTPAERGALDIFIKLNRATAAVNRAVHQPLRAAGITDIQFGILDSLYFGGPLSVSGLAEKNLCTQNSISTVVDTMERNGLVQRDRSAADRRVVTVSLTPKGEELFATLWPDHVARIVAAISTLSDAEQTELNRLLRKLGRAIESLPRPREAIASANPTK